MIHTIDPFFDENSRVLILGSFPSVKSRESGFFYGHPQNRFWKVLAAVFSEEAVPISICEKKSFLLRHGIALFDVIASCDIDGSSDTSIRNVVPNDITQITSMCDIKSIFVNGKTAERLYKKHIFSQTGRMAQYLPSTSPANAAMSLEKLIDAWNIILLDS